MTRETELPVSRLHAVHLALFGLVLLPAASLYVLPNIETSSPWLTLLLSTAAAIASALVVYRFPWSQPDPHPAPSRVPALVTVLAATTYARRNSARTPLIELSQSQVTRIQQLEQLAA